MSRRQPEGNLRISERQNQRVHVYTIPSRPMRASIIMGSKNSLKIKAFWRPPKPFKRPLKHRMNWGWARKALYRALYYNCRFDTLIACINDRIYNEWLPKILFNESKNEGLVEAFSNTSQKVFNMFSKFSKGFQTCLSRPFGEPCKAASTCLAFHTHQWQSWEQHKSSRSQ